jgi:hypothetical protein
MNKILFLLLIIASNIVYVHETRLVFMGFILLKNFFMEKSSFSNFLFLYQEILF